MVKSLAHLPFFILVFWRGAICLGIAYYFVRRQKISPWVKNRKTLILRGIAGTLALFGFFHTLHTMPLASAVTIQYLSPILTVLVAGVFFGERVSAVHWLCSLLGFAGVYVIQGYDTRVGMIEALIGIGSAVASAVAYNSVRALRASENEWVVMFYFPLVATVISLPIAASQWVWPSAQDWPAVLLIGLLTQIAQFFLTRGYQRDKASKVASASYFGVIYAVFFGLFLFDEKLGPATTLGIGIILISVLGSAFGQKAISTFESKHSAAVEPLAPDRENQSARPWL